MSVLIIKNGTLVTEEMAGDIWIVDGKIAKPEENIPENAQVIDAEGLLVCPGFIDMHCHLRDPGFTHKENIQTGTLAAARGGFATICPMANTSPVIDSVEMLEYVQLKAEKSGHVQVLQHAALTKGLAGEQLVEMQKLSEAGAVAFSDDGKPYSDLRTLKLGFEFSATFGHTIVSHAEERELAGHGSIREGKISLRLGETGIPSECESVQVAKEIELLHSVPRARLHFSHISTARSVELIRRAKNDGLLVTCETTPHHISLTQEAVEEFGTNAKMNPPLGTETDRQAVIKGLLDGTIDALATDHAPHSKSEKNQSLKNAPFGIIGFETALPIYLKELVFSNKIKIEKLIELLAFNPANILGIKRKKNFLELGSEAFITIIDLNKSWKFMNSSSKAQNSPFWGKEFKGKALHVISGRKYTCNN